MTVTPIYDEPGRYWVSSESEPLGPPHLVDMNDDGVRHCSCQIIHNRTEARAHCKHIVAVRAYLVECWNCRDRIGSNSNCPICTRLAKDLPQ